MKRGNTPNTKKSTNQTTNINSLNNNKNSKLIQANKNNSTNNINSKEIQAKDEKYADDKIIAKLKKKGFEALTLEEMACTLISPTFESEYAIATGEDWTLNFKSKVKDRLNHAKFDIKWMNQVNTSKFVGEFSVFYDIVAKGDIQKATEFMKKNIQYSDELLSSTDKNKKSPLHIAAKNGFTTLATVLIDRGFSVFARDKFLRTPMHLAGQFGHAALVDLFLKRKSDIYARDSCGRTVLHYACCSNSIDLVTLLLGSEPELVHTRDTYGRTPLHYLVWNTNPNLLEIGRRVLDAKAEVDSEDDEGITPLQYASEGGKGKIIPLLLRYGANPTKRDGRNHRTALELACTEHIREMIIVYSGKPYKLKEDDINYLKTGVEGEKIDPQDKEITYEDKGNMRQDPVKRGRQIAQPKPQVQKSLHVIKEKSDDANFNEILMESQKKKLMDFLRKIQEYGVQTMQHLSKPYLYSGSWLEDVKSIDDLQRVLNGGTVVEGIMKIFNVLHSYEKAYPIGKGNEIEMMNFFSPDSNNNMNGMNGGRQNFSNQNNQNNMIHQNQSNPNLNNQNVISQNTNQSQTNANFTGNNNNMNNNNTNQNFSQEALDVQKQEMEFLKNEIKDLKKKVEESKKTEEHIETLKEKIQNYENENIKLKTQTDGFLEKISSLDNELISNKNLIEENKIKEEKSKEQMELLGTKLKEMKVEVIHLQEQEKKVLKSTLSSNLAFSIKNNDYLSKDQYSLADEKSIYTFIKLIETNTLGLDQMLMYFDKDNDLHIFKNEFCNLLEEINLPMDDRNAVLKLAGFTDLKLKLGIKNIIDNFYKRDERRYTRVNDLLFKIAYIMHNNYIEIEKLYSFLKLNDTGDLSFNQFKQALNSIDIILGDSDLELIFKSCEINKDSKIGAEEILDKIKIRKNIIDNIANIDNKIRYNMTSSRGLSPEDRNKELYSTTQKNKLMNNSFTDSKYNFKTKDLEYGTKDKINNTIGKNTVNDINNYTNNKDNNEDNNVNVNDNDNDNNDNDDNKRNVISENSQDDEIQEVINPIADIAEKTKLSKLNESKIGNVNTKMINGELKVQIKSAENIILPKGMLKSCEFFLRLSLEGANDDLGLDSKRVEANSDEKIVFNWAARIPILSRTLHDMKNFFKLEMFLTSSENDLPSVKLGESTIFWTFTLHPNNHNKFAINDKFEVLSTDGMKQIGSLAVMAKFIPIGTMDSFYDDNSKLKRIPKSLMGNVKEKKTNEKDNSDEIVNTGTNDNKSSEGLVKTKKKLSKSKNEENRVKKHIEFEDTFFLSFQYENEVLYSTEQFDFSELLNNLPHSFDCDIEHPESEQEIKLTVILYEKVDEIDLKIGSFSIEMDNTQSYFESSDNKKLKIVKFDDILKKDTDLKFYYKIVCQKSD